MRHAAFHAFADSASFSADPIRRFSGHLSQANKGSWKLRNRVKRDGVRVAGVGPSETSECALRASCRPPPPCKDPFKINAAQNARVLN